MECIFLGQDDEINVDKIQNTFDAPKFVFSIGLNGNQRNCISVYGKEYSQEIQPAPDGIIEFLLEI